MYNVLLAVQCIYRGIDEGGEDGNGKGENEIPGGWENVEIACLGSCVQMTWFYVVSWRRN